MFNGTKTARRNTFLKVTVDEVEVPHGCEEIQFEDDGSLKVRLYGDARTRLEETTKQMKDFFFRKPHFADVANALILLGLNHSHEEIAEAIDKLNRRRPKTDVETQLQVLG